MKSALTMNLLLFIQNIAFLHCSQAIVSLNPITFQRVMNSNDAWIIKLQNGKTADQTFERLQKKLLVNDIKIGFVDCSQASNKIICIAPRLPICQVYLEAPVKNPLTKKFNRNPMHLSVVDFVDAKKLELYISQAFNLFINHVPDVDYYRNFESYANSGKNLLIIVSPHRFQSIPMSIKTIARNASLNGFVNVHLNSGSSDILTLAGIQPQTSGISLIVKVAGVAHAYKGQIADKVQTMKWLMNFANAKVKDNSMSKKKSDRSGKRKNEKSTSSKNGNAQPPPIPPQSSFPLVKSSFKNFYRDVLDDRTNHSVYLIAVVGNSALKELGLKKCTKYND